MHLLVRCMFLVAVCRLCVLPALGHLAPVRLVLYHNEFVRMFVGNSGGHTLTLVANYADDDIWLYDYPASFSQTYEVSDADPTRGTELFYLSSEVALRLPVRYGYEALGLENVPSGVHHRGSLGLGSNSPLWQYWDTSTHSPYCITLGVGDACEGSHVHAPVARVDNGDSPLDGGARQYTTDCRVDSVDSVDTVDTSSASSGDGAESAAYRLVFARDSPYTYVPSALLHAFRVCVDMRTEYNSSGEYCWTIDVGEERITSRYGYTETAVRRHPTEDREIILGRIDMRHFTVYDSTLEHVQLRPAFRLPDERGRITSTLCTLAAFATWTLWTIATNPSPHWPAANAGSRARTQRPAALAAHRTLQSAIMLRRSVLLLEFYAIVIGVTTLVTHIVGVCGRKIVSHLLRTESLAPSLVLWIVHAFLLAAELPMFVRAIRRARPGLFRSVFATADQTRASDATKPESAHNQVHSVGVFRRALISTILLLAAWMCASDMHVSWDDRFYLILAATMLTIFNAIYALELLFSAHSLWWKTALLVLLALLSYVFTYFYGLVPLMDTHITRVSERFYFVLAFYALGLVFVPVSVAARFRTLAFEAQLDAYRKSRLLDRFAAHSKK